jgi:hypothetical protein
MGARVLRRTAQPKLLRPAGLGAGRANEQRSRRLTVLALLICLAVVVAPGASGVPGDPTPPVITPVLTGTLGNGGWYVSNVTVNWTVSDPESVILSSSGCDARTLAADTPGTRLTCGASSDGGEATVTKTIKLDKTAPAVTGASAARAPDANGWYNQPLVVSFAGLDGTSGVEACSAPTYSGPDSGTASISGSCRDRAGNTSVVGSFPFKYDATAPDVSPTPSRGPDANGWYNRPLAVAFAGSDATSGIESCSTPTYAGPDAAIASLSGSCRDRAGNTSGSGSFALKYDATAPEVTGAVPARPPDRGGWYNRPVAFAAQGRDATSGIDSCGAASYDGPDGATARVTGSCGDKAGNTGSATFPLQYDATGPTVAASPSRSADANGWYNRPLTVAFAGSDAVSGVEACSPPQAYDGPDSAAASVGGSCHDRAGNVGPVSSFPLKYDSTAPSLARVRARPGNRRVALSWRTSPDVAIVEIERSGKTIYRGGGRSFVDSGLTNGVRHAYVLTGYDEARNAVRRRVVARPAALFSPAAGARVTAPPLLAWSPVPNATYYNVQLIRSRKVLSSWPTRPRLRLKRSWVYAGRRYRLTPGRYRWYVWPRFGPRSTGRYGRLLGGSSFVVTGS